MDTLKDFLFSNKHLPIDEQESDIVEKSLKRMCTDAREGIKFQCARKYGFTDREPPQETQRGKLAANELTGFPTNNIDTESNFPKFGRLLEVVSFRNRKFSVKGI